MVLINYNGETLLPQNLPKIFSLLEKQKEGYELIAVDDCSTDGSRQVLENFKKRHPRLKLIFKDKNEGFAGSADAGIRAALGEIVFTLKNDSYPEGEFYFRLILKHFQNPTKRPVFAVSAALKTIENGKTEIRGQGILVFARGFFLHFRTPKDYQNWRRGGEKLSGLKLTEDTKLNAETKIQYSAWADGGAAAFRKDLYLKIGGFDPLYNPFYWEDVDLGYRAWKAGYEIHFEPEAVLIHEHEKGVIGAHYSKEEVKKISFRNQFFFVWKNAALDYLGRHLLYLPYHLLAGLKNRDFQFIGGFFLALAKLSKVIKKRAGLALQGEALPKIVSSSTRV